MTTEQLEALREELRTQDSACTEHPLFCVFQKQRIYGLDSMSTDAERQTRTKQEPSVSVTSMWIGS